MERFLLQHQVFRTLRDASNESQAAATETDAFQIADVVAELTTANAWRQEVHDIETGRRWVRTSEQTWSLAAESN